MQIKKFITVLIVILSVLGLLLTNAAQYTSDGSFENESDGTSAADTDKFSYDWEHSIVSGEAKVTEKENKKYLSVTGFSEFFSYDPIEAPYTYSLDVKLDNPGDVNIFVRSGRNESTPFPFYEWDWYEEKGGKNGTSSTGGPGMLVSLQPDAIRVRIKNMQTDAENEGISSVYYDFAKPEGYDVTKFNNIKFVDNGAKIEIYFNNNLLATADMSDKGIYEQDKDHPPVDFSYFKKVVLKDAAGTEVLKVENARVVAESSRVAFGGRNHPFYVDNVTLTYEVENTPEPTQTQTPEATINATEKATPSATKTTSTSSGIEKGNKIVYIAAGSIGIVIVLAIIFIVIKSRKRAK